jgi:sulfite exporter TauE/SafE
MAAWFEASPLHSSLMMLAFGIGTLPLMITLSYSGGHFVRYFSKNSVRYSFALLILLAGLITAITPWILHTPRMSSVLEALGCRSLF